MAEQSFEPKKSYRKPELQKLANPNLYQVIGTSPEATHEQIKSAYRKNSKLRFPDLGPPEQKAGRDKLMKDINEAKEVLLDPQERELYDILRKLTETDNNASTPAASPPRPDTSPPKQDTGRRRRKTSSTPSPDPVAERQRQDELDRRKREQEIDELNNRLKREGEQQTKGQRLGEKLSYWTNSQEGQAKMAEDMQLLFWAEKNTLGVEKFVRSDEFVWQRVHQVFDNVGTSGNLQTAGGWGEKVREQILSRYRKENVTGAARRLERLEQRLREQNAALKYEHGYGPLKESYIPYSVDFRGPSWKVHPEEQIPTGAEWDSYARGFKTGWERIKKINETANIKRTENWMKW